MGGQLKAWPENAKTLDEILIGDGLCYRGFIEAVPGLHGQFQYAFRPLLPAEITVAMGRINTLSEEGKRAEAEGLVARLISEHITWNTGVYLQLIGQKPMDSRYAENPTADKQWADDLGN